MSHSRLVNKQGLFDGSQRYDRSSVPTAIRISIPAYLPDHLVDKILKLHHKRDYEKPINADLHFSD